MVGTEVGKSVGFAVGAGVVGIGVGCCPGIAIVGAGVARQRPENMALGPDPSPKSHTPDTQSNCSTHRAPAAHGLQLEPPQSISVSCPLRRPSSQLDFVGSRVGLLVGEKLGQDDGAMVGAVGNGVGWTVVGMAVGTEVGTYVGATVGNAVAQSPDSIPPSA